MDGNREKNWYDDEITQAILHKKYLHEINRKLGYYKRVPIYVDDNLFFVPIFSDGKKIFLNYGSVVEVYYNYGLVTFFFEDKTSLCIPYKVKTFHQLVIRIKEIEKYMKNKKIIK